jgi:hypothetical protein
MAAAGQLMGSWWHNVVMADGTGRRKQHTGQHAESQWKPAGLSFLYTSPCNNLAIILIVRVVYTLLILAHHHLHHRPSANNPTQIHAAVVRGGGGVCLVVVEVSKHK